MNPAPPSEPEPDYRVVSIICASPALCGVLQALAANPKGLTQRRLSQLADVSLGHMSEHLAKLAGLGLAKCNNKKVRKGKVYFSTSEGNTTAIEVQRVAGVQEGRTIGGMQIGSKGPV
jgi:hypothetical protein